MTAAVPTRTAAQPDRRRALLIVLLVVAVAAIPGRLAWNMRASALADAGDTREEVRRLDEQVAQARHDKARAADLNDQLQALSAAMPSDPDLASVVEQVEAVAREANVTFVASAQALPTVTGARAASAATTAPPSTAATTASTTPAEGATAGAADGDGAADTGGTAAAATAATNTNFTVEIDVTGTRSNLAAFVEKLRFVPRVLTVERLQWSWQEGATGGADTALVAAHFSVRAYTWSGASRSLPGAPATTAAGVTATATTKAP